MSIPDSNPTLTPEAAQMMKKARIAFAIMIGVMILGLILVGGTLVYRLTRGDVPGATGASAETTYSAASLKLPAGATIISAVAAGGDISVTYRNGSATALRIFDGRTGAILREVPLVSE
jgi:hypothetical protein